MNKELLYEVAKHIIKNGKASTNDISKTFKLKFSETEQIFKELVKLGIIHESIIITREILVKENELEKIFKNN